MRKPNKQETAQKFFFGKTGQAYFQTSRLAYMNPARTVFADFNMCTFVEIK